MILKEWMFRTGKTYRSLAKELECGFDHLNRVANGKTTASPKFALRVEEYTKGSVTRDEVLFPQKYPSFLTLVIPKPRKKKHEITISN